MFISSITDNSSPYEFVIIGTGPAGFTVALELEKQTTGSILIIESGLASRNRGASNLSKVTASGDLAAEYFPVHAQRIYGGTSTIWGGWCGKLEQRAFLAGEWPITFDEIDPYYEPAAEILNLPEEAFLQPETPIEGSDKLVYKPYYTGKPLVRFAKKYHEQLNNSEQIHVLLGHTCTDLSVQENSVRSIELRNTVNPSDVPIQLSVKDVVLACGGIGNSDLLRISGVSQSPALGRGFAEHPHIYSATNTLLNVERIWPSVNKKNPVYHGIQLSSEYCAEHNLLSLTFDFNSRSKEQANMMGQSISMYQTMSTIRAEMPLLPSNVVTQSKKENIFGLPQAHLNFQFNLTPRIHDTWEIFREEFSRTGLGRLGKLQSTPAATGGGHYLCSTRMGDSTDDSVVDKNCKVHETDNLYIAGSSIFSAGGAINPTYSIVAFAIRLASAHP